MGILQESQHQRDLELAELLDKPIDYIKSLGIATPDSIRIYNETKSKLSKKEILKLYTDYKYLDLDAYLKTLMFTSVKKRGKYLYQLIKETNTKVVLDYGSGVGTHAIAFLENNNDVSILDVKDSPLLKFSEKRINKRGYDVHVYDSESLIPHNQFDVILCADVLEHVYDPLRELQKMTYALRDKGILFLEVSNMVKPSSGHFVESINKWKSKGLKYMEKNYTLIRKNTWQKK